MPYAFDTTKLSPMEEGFSESDWIIILQVLIYDICWAVVFLQTKLNVISAAIFNNLVE